MGATKRKPLEPWQLEDAARLKRLWGAKKPMSQQRFAAEYLDATQGAMWQYLDGRIPLNLDAAIKFASGLQVRVSDFSPRLAERLLAAIGAEMVRPAASPTPQPAHELRRVKEGMRNGPQRAGRIKKS